MKRYVWLLIMLLPALVFAAPGDKITVGGMALPLSADSVTDGTTNKAFTASEKAKLEALSSTPAASSIVTDDTHQFTTATEKDVWNSKLSPANNLSDLASPAAARAALGLSNVNDTADADKPVSSAVQAALNAKAPVADPTFTGTVNASAFNSTVADGYHYMRPYNPDGFLGAPLIGMIQTTSAGIQWYNGSAWTASGGGASAIANLTDWPSGLTATELGYLDGATSNIQDQIDAISVGSPVTTVPTYSDQSCTAGQYAFDASYAYFCRATNTWDRIALAGWSNPSPVAPTFSALAIDAAGTGLDVTMSASTTVGSGGSGGLVMACSTAGSVTATYSSGSPGTSYAYTLSPTVYSGDTCTAAYTQPGDGLEGTTGGADVVTASGLSVTNGSEATQGSYGDILFSWDMENTLVADIGGVTGTNSNDTFTATAKVGTYALARSTNYGNVSFNITSTQFDPAGGQIGFWYQSTGYQSASTNAIVKVSYDASNYLLMMQHSSGGIKAQWTVGGTSYVTEYTTTGLTADTWYYITYKWHPGDTGNDAVLTIYNADGSTFGTATLATLVSMSQPTTLVFGNASGDAGRPIVDHVAISNDITRDMWAVQDSGF